jgi:2-polyprenyl-3-methyl-5-hydroxy-6-metoxy-1,4-benzoquinol methylase
MGKSVMKKIKDCPFCGGRVNQKFSGLEDRLFTTERTFNVGECQSCGVGMLNPMPTGDASMYYPTNYLSAEEAKVEANTTKKFDLEKWYRYNQYSYDFGLMAKASGIHLKDAESYLDIGCGSGERVTFAAEQGCANTHGVDKFDFAKNKSKQEVKLISSEITNYKPTKKYQVASMFHVLEHVENPHEVLTHIYKNILDSGGNLVIQVPNYESLEKNIFKSRWFSFDVPRHLWQYNENALTRMLEETGYSITGVYKTNAPLHPVTFVPSLFRELDVQRIWVNKKHGIMYKQFMTMLWAGFTLLTIPFNIFQNIIHRASMLTVIATK